MAKYNREFLVPYLQNLCALYFAKDKLFKHHGSIMKEIKELERGQPLYSPAYPEYEPTFNMVSLAVTAVGCLLFLLSIVSFKNSSESISWSESGFYELLGGFLSVIGIPLIIGGAISLIRSYFNNKKTNEDLQYQYERQLRADRETRLENDKAREQIPALEEERNKCYNDIIRIKKLIDQAEGANVIPGQYRGDYAAVYLYDYFAHSREDDVAMALNTFVLEQIKDKLDTIISNQSDIILNQCMMLANQRRSIEQQESYTAMMESKLNQIQASNEERNQYLSMIESSAESTAFFVAADYIKRI